MFEQAQEGFAGATALMEWMVRQGSLPLRKAKIIVEKAVKYSDREGGDRVSYSSLRSALSEMKIDLPISKQDVEAVQRPESMLGQNKSIGMPSEKRVRESIAWLRKRMKGNRGWLVQKRREIDKTKRLLSKMEKEFGS